MSEESIFLGINEDTKGIVHATELQRSTHMQVIGSTGTGKSKFLEHLIREDIKADSGLCLIDPHGYLYHDVLKWLQAIDWPTDKIILFDPSEDGYVTGFNPLKLSTKDLSYHVDSMVRACAKVWGGEDTDKTPLLKRCLRITLHALAEHQLTLFETQYLTNPTDKTARQFLTQGLVDPIIRQQWDYFNSHKITQRQFYEEFGSTINRLMEFLAAERIRLIIGQKERTLDFRKIMDEGYIVLVNLAGGRSISHDNARLLGTLIVNDLFLQATERPKGSRPFYLYIDECGLFINEDIARILDEGRKFGLHLVLAHQHLAQLKKAGDDVYFSVMTDAKTKVVFGGLSPDDARILAEQMFLGEIDLDEYKHSLDRPTVVGYTTTWLKNFSKGIAEGTTYTESKAISEGETTGRSWSESSGESRMQGRGDSFGSSYAFSSTGAPLEMTTMVSQGEVSTEAAGKMNMRGYSESEARQMMETQGESVSTSFVKTSQEGESETLKPILEDRPTAVYSLEEQIWKAMNILVNQPTRHAVVKLPGLFTKRIIVPPVEELATSDDDTVPFYKEQCHKISRYNQRAAQAKEEIETRQQLLITAVKRYELEKAAEPKQFKQPKKQPKKVAQAAKQPEVIEAQPPEPPQDPPDEKVIDLNEERPKSKKQKSF